MPAETHQQGRRADVAGVVELVCALLEVDSDPESSPGPNASLADCGLTAEDLGWLWETVCEELAERSLSHELEETDLELSMTVVEAAEVMASALGAGGDDDS